VTAPKLTSAQRKLLWMGACFVHRAEVRTARSLMKLGLGHLDDNGYLRCNDERWFFSPTDAGRAALRGEP
jgi:hypothetical protein